MLSKKHEIILCALNDTKLHPDALQALHPYCKNIHIIPLSLPVIGLNLFKTIFTGKPFQVGYFYDNDIQKKVDDIIEKHNPHHIYCQLTRVTEYVRHSRIAKTLDYQDAFSKGIERRIEGASVFTAPFLKEEFKRNFKDTLKESDYTSNVQKLRNDL